MILGPNKNEQYENPPLFLILIIAKVEIINCEWMIENMSDRKCKSLKIWNSKWISKYIIKDKIKIKDK